MSFQKLRDQQNSSVITPTPGIIEPNAQQIIYTRICDIVNLHPKDRYSDEVRDLLDIPAALEGLPSSPLKNVPVFFILTEKPDEKKFTIKKYKVEFHVRAIKEGDHRTVQGIKEKLQAEEWVSWNEIGHYHLKKFCQSLGAIVSILGPKTKAIRPKVIEPAIIILFPGHKESPISHPFTTFRQYDSPEAFLSAQSYELDEILASRAISNEAASEEMASVSLGTAEGEELVSGASITHPALISGLETRAEIAHIDEPASNAESSPITEGESLNEIGAVDNAGTFPSVFGYYKPRTPPSSDTDGSHVSFNSPIPQPALPTSPPLSPIALPSPPLLPEVEPENDTLKLIEEELAYLEENDKMCPGWSEPPHGLEQALNSGPKKRVVSEEKDKFAEAEHSAQKPKQ